MSLWKSLLQQETFVFLLIWWIGSIIACCLMARIEREKNENNYKRND